MNSTQTKAMAYGIKMEQIARKAYGKERKKTDESVEVLTVRLACNTRFPDCACNLDAIAISNSKPDKLVEIKILYSARYKDPRKPKLFTNKQDPLAPPGPCLAWRGRFFPPVAKI